jgi:hypothetical protein
MSMLTSPRTQIAGGICRCLENRLVAMLASAFLALRFQMPVRRATRRCQ